MRSVIARDGVPSVDSLMVRSRHAPLIYARSEAAQDTRPSYARIPVPQTDEKLVP